MRKNYFIVFFFIGSICSAQIGIGTTSPQEELHIAGVNSTIRIEKLDAVNSSHINDGIKPAPAFVDGNGDVTIGVGSGSIVDEPINFLVIVDNFIPDNPYGYNEPDQVNDTGIVINNTNVDNSVTEEIVNFSISVPQTALIEVKYGITLYAKGEDMTQHPPPFFDVPYGIAINMSTFFCIDLDNDGVIDGTEFSNKYGIKGQYFETEFGGISGYPYMNGQAYFTLPSGDYGIHFYGVIGDFMLAYTSVGFGGKEDYLKIRIYN